MGSSASEPSESSESSSENFSRLAESELLLVVREVDSQLELWEASLANSADFVVLSESAENKINITNLFESLLYFKENTKFFRVI